MGADQLAARQDRAFARRVQSRGYDLVYVNTVVPRREILSLGKIGIPIILHVHELDSAVMQWVGEEGLSRVVPCVTHFIAASAGVRDYLVRRWQVPESKVSVVHSFTKSDLDAADFSDARKQLRSTLRLSDDDILVGNCGTLDWRKGADLFVQVARFVTAGLKGRRAHFIWVGADRSSIDYRRFLHDVQACGLADVITVMENRPNPAEIFAAMDIFALTSREDPFPLVMLEAASMRLPVVCFESSGGGPEFVGRDAGLVAPYLDVPAFARHVLTLAGDAQARNAIGSAGRRKVRECFTIEQQAPRLRDVIMRVLTT
jgi:glycosyltransferase involved in cell wall biosynthesis